MVPSLLNLSGPGSREWNARWSSYCVKRRRNKVSLISWNLIGASPASAVDAALKYASVSNDLCPRMLEVVQQKRGHNRGTSLSKMAPNVPSRSLASSIFIHSMIDS
jgi:hypothetical protein